MKPLITTAFLIIICFTSITQELSTVNAKLLNVRSGAGTNFEVITQVQEGDKVNTYSTIDSWTEIETESGVKGYVSTEFLSKDSISNSESPKRDKKNNSWFGTIFVIVAVIVIINSARKTLFAKKGSSSSSSHQSKSPIKKQQVNDPNRKNAVFRFRIKGNGTAGGVKYVDGMNIEVAVSGFGASGSPFNTTVEKLFVQEFARKYNIEPRFHSSIKMLFKRDRLDVEVL